MTKTNLLKAKMAEHEVSNQQAANKLNLSMVQFRKKLNNEAKFNQVEIKTIKQLLFLNDADIVEIFLS